MKKAVNILRKGGGAGAGAEDGGRGRGFRGQRGGRGTRGRGVSRQRGRGGRGDSGQYRGPDEDFGSGLYLGDNADGERLAKRVGTEKMNELVEGFEEMSWRVLPSPMDDAYYDALDTNLKVCLFVPQVNGCVGLDWVYKLSLGVGFAD